MTPLADSFEKHGTAIQVVLYAGLLTTLWFIELVVSGQPIREKWRYGRANVAMMLLALPVQLIMTIFVVMAARWVTINHWGLLQMLPGASSSWSKYGVAFILLDLGDYVYHVTMHRYAWLWRFHLVHHCAHDVDVSTTIREHPGDTFVRVLFLVAWVLLIGAGWGVLLLRQTVETIANITSHLKYRVPGRLGRVLGWVFITPNLHHVHHHNAQPYTDSNFGDVLSVWDRLFGTYAELPSGETVFGVDTQPSKQVTESFREIVMLPFRATGRGKAVAPKL
jgi:sterol desaturase/sphingolipid hydroxylase (fatty acid hydroxylase superfamily)